MSQIKTFSFDDEDKFKDIKSYEYGRNWPVVYLIEDGVEMYVGETTNLFNRCKQHYENSRRNKLKNIHVITDGEFNKSASLDIEAWLIQYIAADGVFELQNGNGGLQNHNYFDKEKYKAKFELVWEKLKKIGLVKKDLLYIRNTDVFKYSPYKTLTDEQIVIAQDIFEDVVSGQNKSVIVTGKPGTGKTILAVFLIKYLREHPETKNLNIGLVVPMSSLRGTLRKVFKNIKGLKPSMVIGPSDVVKQKYDLLLVDEAHRLKRRKNLTNFGSFDATNSRLGWEKETTELDWVLKSSKSQILFYDKNQSIKPTDVESNRFEKLSAKRYELTNQLRVEGGDVYIQFIEDLFDLKENSIPVFKEYDFQLFDDIREMVNAIKIKDVEFGLSRIVAGYAWPWTKSGDTYDIEIDGLKLLWNTTNEDWVNSPNAINEVGCIHTVQGYDLNYVGVIIGPELSYDEEKNILVVDKSKYKDVNGHRGISDPAELEKYIINIYKTLLSRGIKGTYIHIVDKKLEKYFKERMQGSNRSLKQSSVLVKNHQ